MRGKSNERPESDLPPCIVDFIDQVTRKMRYRRQVREDVQAELTAHFEDELRGCENPQEKGNRAQRLVEEFGDAGLLAILCRRAKKRCRPLWVRAFARTMQGMGVFLLVFVPYTIWFVRGKPNPMIDYLPQLNALHRPSGPVTDNAWPYYEKAMRLAVEPNHAVRQTPWLKSFDLPSQPLTSQEREALEGWIEVNSLAWLQLEFATARSQCHRVYRKLPGKPLIMDSIDDPPPGNLRWLTFLGRCKARLALEQGRVDESLGYCLTLLCAGAHWQKNASLIEQLLGSAVSASACGEILSIASSAEELPLDQLIELQTRIAAPCPDEYPVATFEGERLVMLDAVQYEFTRGWLGGGHHVVGSYTGTFYAVWGITNTPKNWKLRAAMMPLDVAASMIHARRNRTMAKINERYKRMNEIAKLSPYDRRERCIPDMGQSMGWVEKLRYGFVWLLTPAERRVSEIAFRARADYEALVTIVALKRYRLQKGGYPSDLKILVQAGYLKEIPSDPYSARALVYRTTDSDFILYSLGPNFADDGGEPGCDEEGRPKRWGAKGDMVFWPVSP